MAIPHNSMYGNVVGFPVPIVCCAKDTGVSISYNADFNSVQVSGDGRSNTRTVMNDRSATITVTISKSSISNALLDSQFVLQEAGGAAPAMSITDLNTGAVFVAEACWIKKTPDIAFGEEADDRAWVFETDYLVQTHGNAAIIESNSP